jgi:hypothetical protein
MGANESFVMYAADQAGLNSTAMLRASKSDSFRAQRGRLRAASKSGLDAEYTKAE